MKIRVAELAAALALAALFPADGRALDAASEPAVPANALLRQAVAKQGLLPASGYFTWMDRVEKTQRSVTKRMVMTPDGILSRTVAINDRDLSAEERREDDARINRLLDPEEMREKAQKQRQLQERIERLLRAVPDALDCTYQREVNPRSPARTAAVLECSPKPDFSPPNRESQVLAAMHAVVTIDRIDTRITHFEGTLVEDVRFAWGFLAKLNRGGHLLLKQEKLESGLWCVTRMELRVDGRIVMVKPLHIERRESAWAYRAVPAMSVPQALEFLRTNPSETERAGR